MVAAQTHTNKKGDVRITIDQRYCPDCRAATILGKVFRRSDNDWQEINDLNFTFVSEPGEHVSMFGAETSGAS